MGQAYLRFQKAYLVKLAKRYLLGGYCHSADSVAAAADRPVSYFRMVMLNVLSRRSPSCC